MDAERSRGEDGRKFAEFFSQEVEKFKQAEQLYVDLRGLSDVAAVPGATAKVAGVQMPQSITDVADAIAQVAPLFVHFDEIGVFQAPEAVRKLRDGVIRTWEGMNRDDQIQWKAQPK